MGTREIVKKAWQDTQIHLKKLIWYGAVPAFFSILVSVTYLGYQYNAFRHSALFNSAADQNVLTTAYTVLALVKSHPRLTITALVIAALVFACYTLLPPIFNGTLIAGSMRIQNGQPLDRIAEVGVRRFFPIFEFRLMMGSFSITTLFTESSFILRWWGERVFFVALPILLFVGIVGFIISILFTYSEYYIVLQNHRLIRSISDSTILVLANLRKTILIFVLMLLIGIRIILNVLLILFIPMMIVVVTSYVASTALAVIGLIFSVIVGLALALVSSYLMGLFHIFTTMVWVMTFKELTQTAGAPLSEPEADQNVLADDVISDSQSGTSPEISPHAMT